MRRIERLAFRRAVIRRVACGDGIKHVAAALNSTPRRVCNVIRYSWKEYVAFLDRLDENTVDIVAALYILKSTKGLSQTGMMKIHEDKAKVAVRNRKNHT